jgi:L-ornithine N5-oxygenase
MGKKSADIESDVTGVGFGPSNLALAVALREELGGDLSATFFERQPYFGWHRGMLIEGMTMQVSFLKDLVSMRNPQSPYTFVSYLHAMDRLADFINGKYLYPLRTEFHDYLEWVARDFQDLVSYGTEVLAILPVYTDNVIEHLDVVIRDQAGERVCRTRTLVLGLGLTPWLPPGVSRSSRVWHSGELLGRLAEMPREWRRFAVVGSGQSAAEAVSHIHERFSDARVDAVYGRVGYSVADDSPFANGVFDPDSVDWLHSASPELRERMLEYHKNTNYSVVDLDLLQALYQRVYEERIVHRQRLHMRRTSRINRVRERHDSVLLDVEFLPDGRVEELEVDAVVYATGYRPADPLNLLGEIASESKRDSAGRLVLDRDHRIVTSDAVRCAVYVHGAAAEHSHGLSAGLLSTTAVRAGELAESIKRNS